MLYHYTFSLVWKCFHPPEWTSYAPSTIWSWIMKLCLISCLHLPLVPWNLDANHLSLPFSSIFLTLLMYTPLPSLPLSSTKPPLRDQGLVWKWAPPELPTYLNPTSCDQDCGVLWLWGWGAAFHLQDCPLPWVIAPLLTEALPNPSLSDVLYHRILIISFLARITVHNCVFMFICVIIMRPSQIHCKLRERETLFCSLPYTQHLVRFLIYSRHMSAWIEFFPLCFIAPTLFNGQCVSLDIL